MDRILVVDDDPVIRLLIQRMLKDDGYALLMADDGAQARSLVENSKEPISAVLLDWQMPQMTGIDFLRWVKQEEKHEHIPVIMQTSMKDPQNIKEGIDAGAFYYLTKPVEEGVLRSIVRAALSDFHHTQVLLDRLRSSDNPFGLLQEGLFRFKTTGEAEFLAVAVANTSPVPQKAMVISEILLNAVEHGNLGITYDQKTDYIAKGTLRDEVDRRLALPENAEKWVGMKLKRYENALTIEVEDQGPGFEYQKYLQMDESRVFDNHGRGIAITNEYLGLNYIGKGNKVVVTIPIE
jgi:sigma-B regulation protein RsbU (phosphoserine phosphatase)